MMNIRYVLQVINCPLCNNLKPKGALTCHRCEVMYGIKKGNPDAMKKIRARERNLRKADKQLHGVLSEMLADPI